MGRNVPLDPRQNTVPGASSYTMISKGNDHSEVVIRRVLESLKGSMRLSVQDAVGRLCGEGAESWPKVLPKGDQESVGPPIALENSAPEGRRGGCLPLLLGSPRWC